MPEETRETIKDIENGIEILKKAIEEKDDITAKVMVGAIGLHLTKLSIDMGLPYRWVDKKKLKEVVE
jgi:hypothetical protein